MKIYVVVKSRLTAPASSTCIPLERLLKMAAANWRTKTGNYKSTRSTPTEGQKWPLTSHANCSKTKPRNRPSREKE